jgi:glutamine synthetase
MATKAKKASSKGGDGNAVAKVLELAKDSGAKIVDYRFTDMPGMWQHFSSPIGTLDADTFEEGVGFDGSSIRGFQAIDESECCSFPIRPRRSWIRLWKSPPSF